MANTGKIIGIDLGTTNSAVAVMEGGSPKVIQRRKGEIPFLRLFHLKVMRFPLVMLPSVKWCSIPRKPSTRLNVSWVEK